MDEEDFGALKGFLVFLLAPPIACAVLDLLSSSDLASLTLSLLALLNPAALNWTDIEAAGVAELRAVGLTP